MKAILLIDVDDHAADSERIELSEYVEREAGWLEESGITLDQYKLYDPTNLTDLSNYNDIVAIVNNDRQQYSG